MQNRSFLLTVFILTATIITGLSFYSSSRLTANSQAIESSVGYLDYSDQQAVKQILHKGKSEQKIHLALIFVVSLAGLLCLLGTAYFKLLIPLKTLRSAFTHDGSIDLTHLLDGDDDSEFQQRLRRSEHHYRTARMMVTSFLETAQKSQQAINDLTANTSDSASVFAAQRDEINRAATAMTQMTATIQEVARNATEASDASVSTNRESLQNKEIMVQCMSSITQLAGEILEGANAVRVLEKDTDQIGTVLDVIRGIAEQTNLLALNAAIEAARAGDQGRGFAVVADEVRVLAQNSQQSTEEIQKMIKQLRLGTQSAVEAMEKSNTSSETGVGLVVEADSALDNIATSSQTMCDLNAQIATAAQEQSMVAEEINSSIVTISEITEQISKGWNAQNDKRELMKKLLDDLVEKATQFKV